jgi:hypothetical protein
MPAMAQLAPITYAPPAPAPGMGFAPSAPAASLYWNNSTSVYDAAALNWKAILLAVVVGGLVVYAIMTLLARRRVQQQAPLVGPQFGAQWPPQFGAQWPPQSQEEAVRHASQMSLDSFIDVPRPTSIPRKAGAKAHRVAFFEGDGHGQEMPGDAQEGPRAAAAAPHHQQHQQHQQPHQPQAPVADGPAAAASEAVLEFEPAGYERDAYPPLF